MDFGSPPKVAALSGATAVPRAEVSAQPGSVAVDLAPEKTVQSASAGGAVKLDIGADAQRQGRPDEQARQAASSVSEAGQQNAQQSLQRRIVIEQNTHSVVTQIRDPHTGETVSMIPDEMTLKLRLFARALAERQEAQPAANPSIERSA